MEIIENIIENDKIIIKNIENTNKIIENIENIGTINILSTKIIENIKTTETIETINEITVNVADDNNLGSIGSIKEIENDKFDAIVLSGGGSKGILTLGALYYYHKIGRYDMDYVKTYSGTSIGSAINLLLVCGLTPFEIFIEVCNVEQLADIKNIANMWELSESMGLLSINILTDKLEPMIKKKLLSKYDWNSDKLPSLKELYTLTGKTLISTASNVTTIKCEYISYKTHPDICCIEPVKFSCNLPVIFKRIKYNDCYYVDGGLMDNFPLKCIDNGVIKILGIVISGIDLSMSDEQYIGYFYRLISMLPKGNTELRYQLAGNNTTLIKLEYNKSSTFELNIQKDKKMEMFLNGYKSAETTDVNPLNVSNG